MDFIWGIRAVLSTAKPYSQAEMLISNRRSRKQLAIFFIELKVGLWREYLTIEMVGKLEDY